MNKPNKLPLCTPDLTERNYAALAALFPNAVTESIDENGVVVRAIDADVLRQEINTHVVSGKEERYQFTWPDKKKAVLLANAPIAATLRPCREESVDFDNTENLYIEGDNLDVLKLLRETYLNRVKMIYIDPPYNTGNDFIYEDDFSEDTGDFLARDHQYDKDGNRMVRNLDSNGRFHTDWLNMMYPRLRVARDLLTDDGVIFISIDDREVHDLRKICDQILGEANFIGCAGRISKKANNQGDYWAPNFDYLLTYAKNKSMCPAFFGGINYSSYDMIEESGPRKGEKYQLIRLYMTSLDPMRGCSSQRYYIECPDGSYIIPPGEHYPEKVGDAEFIAPKSNKDKVWRWSYPSYLAKKDSIIIKQGRSSNVVGINGAPTTWNAYTKTYLNDVLKKQTSTPNSFIENHINQSATHELNKLEIPFNFAKPTSLIKYLAEVCCVEDGGIVLDFFSGSATTAHAVMQLNAEDGGKRKFIMVQLPEVCPPDSEAAKAGYKNICEIGKERIRRAGAKIVASGQGLVASDQGRVASGQQSLVTNHSPLDTGFRVLKLDSSNMKDVYYTPQDTVSAGGTFQRNLDELIDNIKPDRGPEDLLFQIMLDLGIPLSAKIEKRVVSGQCLVASEKTTQGQTVYYVNPASSDNSPLTTNNSSLSSSHSSLTTNHYLIACFDRATDEIVTEIAKSKPYYAVFRDSSFASDAALTNFEQIFKTYSPETKRKVL